MHMGSGVPDISMSAHRSLQNFRFPRWTRLSSQRQPWCSHFMETSSRESSNPNATRASSSERPGRGGYGG
jgi:hypothetical protein